MARLALSKGIDVYNPLWERVLKKLSPDHFVPSPRHHLYPEIFKSLDNKISLKNEAKQILESRLRGEVDRGIAYLANKIRMRKEFFLIMVIQKLL